MKTDTYIEGVEEKKAYQNPSYDNSLSAKQRMQDFLGAYHIILHGVKAHEPFSLKNEGKPNEWCDTDEKKRFVEFVESLVKDALLNQKEEMKKKVEGLKIEPDEDIKGTLEILEGVQNAYSIAGEIKGHNQALDEVIKTLEGEEK